MGADAPGIRPTTFDQCPRHAVFSFKTAQNSFAGIFATTFVVRCLRLELTTSCQSNDVLSRQCACGASIDMLYLQPAVLDDVFDAAHLCSNLFALQGHLSWMYRRGKLPVVEDGHG